MNSPRDSYAVLRSPSVRQPEEVIHDYIAHRNRDPKPFIWTASVRTIMKKVRKANETLASLH